MARKILGNIFYVYAHYRLDTGEVFYIGKGYGKRYLENSRGSHWKSIVKKYGFKAEILAENLSEAEAYNFEKILIKKIGRSDLKLGPLANKTDGGVGGTGFYHSAETLLIIGAASRSIPKEIRIAAGKKQRGKIVTEETKKLQSKAKLGVPRKEFTKETRDKMSRPQKLKTCSYCSKQGGNAMTRWHFENCKEKGRQ